MDDEIYQIAFQIILHAGNSKSKSMMALAQSRVSNHLDAEVLLNDAFEELNIAHEVQTTMIQQEANGEKTEMNLIMVHAQDHIGMATVMYDMAKEMLYMYKNFQRTVNE